jgi:hypothetical protein
MISNNSFPQSIQYCKPIAPYSLAQTGFSSCNNCRADAVKGEKCAAKCPVQILHSGVSLYLTSSSQSPSGLQQRTSYSLYLSSSPQSLSGLQQCTSYSLYLTSSPRSLSGSQQRTSYRTVFFNFTVSRMFVWHGRFTVYSALMVVFSYEMFTACFILLQMRPFLTSTLSWA